MRLTKLPIFFSCVLLLFVCGCSTTNHATLPTQAYLDITSHYNAYFNANEKLKATFRSAEESHKDKFDSVIAVYSYSDATEFAPYSSDLDDVVKRSTQAIQLKPASNWSDDHFLLIGIANYLKGDYDKANSSFKYITTEYKEGVDYVKVMRSLGKKVKKYVKAKKKKKPEVRIITMKDGTKKLEKASARPHFSLWIHEPSRSEALIWLIKTYTRQKNYDAAATIVTYARNDDLFYQNLDYELDLVEADLMVSRKDYAGAIKPLESYLDAKKIRKKKKKRVRPLFVLAQCYQETGDNLRAIETYKRVLKSHPGYDMEFYAKIKMAKLGRSAAGSSAEIKKTLLAMAKDGKYRDYWDQIYYELALLTIEEGMPQMGRDLLRKSINSSVSNDDQKALSFLKIAELDYADELYVLSKYNYDSTLLYMAKNDVRYPEIEERNKLLSNLVTQLEIILHEDSVQKLAALPREELTKRIRDKAAKIEEDEQNKKAQADMGMQQGNPNLTNPNNLTQNSQNNQGLTWYFYNTAARASGYNDFVQRWGRRKMEENWRRKNKTSAIADDETEAVKDTTDDSDAQLEAKNSDGSLEAQLMAGIPTTPERLEKSTNRIIEAYYAAGTIYKDGLDNYPKAEVMFSTLNQRFPKNKLLLESYYNLYLIAQKLNQAGVAEDYRRKILTEFSESIIAQILRNPNYINEARQKEQAVFAYYESAYNDYASNQLDSAWYKCKMADNIFKPNPISAKFDLLIALVFSKQNRLGDYVQALNKIINAGKDAEVKKAAEELLSALNKSTLAQIDLSKDATHLARLNTSYGKPDSSENRLLIQLEQAKEQARKSGKVVEVDTTAATQPDNQQPDKAPETPPSGTDTATAGTSKTPAASTMPAEDTTSVYVRSDGLVHYFIVYIKDPETPQSNVMSTLAKLNAFNSTQFESRKLTAKQVLIDSKNKLINVRQFKNREEIMSYYQIVQSQRHLFSELKPEQYTITCISMVNFATLLNEKNIDDYKKFFDRVYK